MLDKEHYSTKLNKVNIWCATPLSIHQTLHQESCWLVDFSEHLGELETDLLEILPVTLAFVFAANP